MRDLRTGLPIVTEEEAERTPMPGEARIVVPDEATVEEVLHRVHNRGRCGECRHFLLGQGQAELQDQQVFERAFEELEHDPAWYGSTHMFGLCDQWEGHMCHAMAPAHIPAHFLNSSLPYEAQDAPQPCPQFVRRQKGVLQSKRHYQGKRRNYEE